MLALLATPALAQSPEPRVLQRALPVYPQQARDDGAEGTVVVRVDVAPDGAVVGAAVVGPVHPELDQAALDAAHKLVFEAAGVAASVDYRFTFDLGVSEGGGPPGPASLHGRVTQGGDLPFAYAKILLVPADPKVDAIDRMTDEHGRFDVDFLPPGRWDVRIDAPGLETQRYAVDLEPGEELSSTFTAVPAGALEIVVVDERATWREVDRGALTANPSPETGFYQLTRRDIESTPGSLEDVSRAAHALPGVVSDGDLLSGFHVRGGEQSDVVFVLDRVPLENPFHLAGFNSIFNPDMIDNVAFYAGTPPASVPGGTSAVMDVTSWDGSPREPGGGVDGAIDLSASSARALVMGPVDGAKKVTVALAARRTYLEGYLQILKWAQLVDTAFAAPEFSELSARAAWRPDHRNRVMLSAMRTGDSLAIVDSDDESMIDVDGSFQLRNNLTLLSLDHLYDTDDGLRWQTTAALTADHGEQERTIGGEFARVDEQSRLYLRSDVVVPITRDARFEVGIDGSRLTAASTGDIQDVRAAPTWAQTGIAPIDYPDASIDAGATWGEANAYAQARYDGPARLRAGVRGTWAGLAGELLASPSAGVSVPLPTGTIPKATVGLYHRVERDPLRLADGYGNPALTAERAASVVVGVDQGFPLKGQESGGLFRVEAYQIQLSNLVVNPDVPSAGSWENAGTGRNRGIDVMLAARQGRWNAQITYSLLDATRYNPLATRFPSAVRPPQDQRHTFSAAGDVQLAARWRVTSRYAYHSGRPVSTVAAVDADHVAITCLNCERLGPFHQVDVRAEWRRAYARYRLTFYAEILNVGYIRSDFLPIHDVDDEGALATTMFKHLPMRPFLGLRLDF